MSQFKKFISKQRKVEHNRNMARKIIDHSTSAKTD